MVGEEQIVREKKTTKKTPGRRTDGEANGSPMDLLYSYTTIMEWVGGNKKGSKNDQGKGRIRISGEGR